jgi:Kef-type K+ transport system membrane component KefB
MSLGTLALIGGCGLAGPPLSALRGGAVPAVVGEILAGIAIGRTGLGMLHTGGATLSFLSDVGCAMLMLSVGMNVPVREQSVQGARCRWDRCGHRRWPYWPSEPGCSSCRSMGSHTLAVYAVLVASGSAAVALPIVQERGLADPEVLSVVAQVAVADIGATLAIPFVLRPEQAGEAVVGSALVAACLVAIYALSRWLRRVDQVRAFRRQGERRHWAIDLRVALIILSGIAWIARRTGASLLIAGLAQG